VWPAGVFTVTKLGRYARNMAEAVQILTDPSNRGMLFRLGGLVYDWNDPFGRPFPQTLAMVAEFEENWVYRVRPRPSHHHRAMTTDQTAWQHRITRHRNAA
jgi:hypothetical protein